MSKPEVERQKSPNLGFWGRIGLESLWIFCKFFSILPYWFRYYVVEPAVFGALPLSGRDGEFAELFSGEKPGGVACYPERFLPYFGGDFRRYLQSGRTHRREMPSGRRRKGSGKADGCGRGPGLDRSDGSFGVLGILFVLGDYRPFAGGRGGLSSPAKGR